MTDGRLVVDLATVTYLTYQTRRMAWQTDAFPQQINTALCIVHRTGNE